MIRASGGRCYVKVRRGKTHGDSMRAFVNRNRGAWTWVVPAPKGHPRTPKLETLRGRSHTMQGAVEAGLNRLKEIYEETP